MILVLTNEEDLTTDFVIRELARDEFIRVNTERLGERGNVTYEFHARDASVVVGDGEGQLNGKEISAVYSRRAELPDQRTGMPDPGLRAFARAEFGALLDALGSLVPARWVNHPHAVRLAEAKPLQLAVAQRSGFRVPLTMITNDPLRAKRFAERQPAGIVVKALSSPRIQVDGQNHIAFTSILPSDQLEILEDVRHAPCIIQEQILKTADIRVTVIDDEVFAVEIDSQSTPDGVVDWRAAPNVPHRIHRLPDEVMDMCRDICSELNLRFGALDLVLDRDGKYVFIEINPSGQWAWLQVLTGIPIAAGIARALRRN